jgi:hypothetical protein
MEKARSLDDEIPADQLMSLKPGWQPTNLLEVLMRDFAITKSRNETGQRLMAMISSADRPAQLAEQKAWIESLWKQIGADDVFAKYGAEQKKVAEDSSSLVFSHMEKALSSLPRNARPASQLATKLTHMKQHKLLDNIALTAINLGIFREPGDIHIHDICAQDGLSGLMMATLRDCISDAGATSSLASEVNQMEGDNFLIVNHILGAKLSRFAYGDSAGLKFENHPERKTYWVANQPPILGTLLEDIAKFEKGTMPEGVALITCLCHCFNPEDTPFEAETLNLVDRQKLMEIITAANFDPNPESRVLAMKAMSLIDCARAKEINRRNPHVMANAQEMPGDWTSGIFVGKAA